MGVFHKSEYITQYWYQTTNKHIFLNVIILITTNREYTFSSNRHVLWEIWKMRHQFQQVSILELKSCFYHKIIASLCPIENWDWRLTFDRSNKLLATFLDCRSKHIVETLAYLLLKTCKLTFQMSFVFFLSKCCCQIEIYSTTPFIYI